MHKSYLNIGFSNVHLKTRIGEQRVCTHCKLTIIKILHFWKISGLLVTYDLHKPVGNRVVSVEVRCAGCRVPKFEPLDPNAVYRILISAFLVGGGDGYGVIKDNLRSHHIIGKFL